MIKKLFSPTAALFLAATLAATALAADVGGTWTWTTKTKKGKEFKQTLLLEADGDELTGELKRGKRGVEISHGKIDGDKITFEVTAKRGDNEITQKYEGTVEGDTITGTVTGGRKGGGGRARDWEARRAE